MIEMVVANNVEHTTTIVEIFVEICCAYDEEIILLDWCFAQERHNEGRMQSMFNTSKDNTSERVWEFRWGQNMA